MKQVFTLICLCWLAFTTYSQEQYIIEGKSYELYTAVEGELTLLWNTIDNDYRYFVEKNGSITELTNTKTEQGYQEEYKRVLNNLTSDADVSTQRLKLTLPSLETFFEEYNSAVDEDYVIQEDSPQLSARLGFFGGVTNAIYTPNPTNEISPLLGAEFEIYSEERMKRHSAFVHLRQVFESEEYDYSATQLTINYRFKIIDMQDFHFFIDAELISLNYHHTERFIYDDNGAITSSESESDFSLDTPIGFGVGAAYRITPTGFLTFGYNDIVALGLENNGEFPIDFSLGYKFKL